MPNDVDLVFIDTSHTYSQTFDELVAYLGHLRPGGVFLLHDTEVRTPDGDGSGIDFPVVQAIEVFIASTGYSVEYVEGCNGLGVIRTLTAYVTTDELRHWIGIENTSADAVLVPIVSSAKLWVDSRCGRRFGAVPTR